MTDKPKDPDEIIGPLRPTTIPGRWKEGQSGSPGGYSSEQRAFNKRFRKLGDKAYDLIEQCLDGTSEHAMDLDPEFRTKVAMWTIERAYGSKVPMPKEDELDANARPEDPLLAALRALAQPKKKEP